MDIAFRNTSSHSQAQSRAVSVRSGRSSKSQTPPLNATLKLDWAHQAMCLFFFDYVISQQEARMSFGFLQGLPDLVTRAPEESLLRNAVAAVSMASLSYQSTFDYLLVEARRRYGVALQMLKTLLSRNVDLAEDSTLATVMCLDFFEVCSQRLPNDSRLLCSKRIL